MLDLVRALGVMPMSSSSASAGGPAGDFLSAVEDVFRNMGQNFQMTTLFIGIGVTLVISVVVFVTIVERQKAPRLRFFRWLREYLNFRQMLIVGLLKFAHLFLATGITVAGIIVMFQGGNDTGTAILVGLAIILVGNLALRLISELFMLVISLWQNITDIRAVVVKDEEAPEEKKPKEKKEKHHKEKTEKAEETKEPVVSEVVVEAAPAEAVAEATAEVTVEAAEAGANSEVVPEVEEAPAAAEEPVATEEPVMEAAKVEVEEVEKVAPETPEQTEAPSQEQ